MSGTYERLLRGERFDVGQAMLKTYVLESHPSSEAPLQNREQRLEFLRNGLRGFDGVAEATEDARLFLFDIPQEDAQPPLSFVVDMMDDRYWLIHTASPTAQADRSIERMVSERPVFDSAWFPGGFLTDFTALGRLYKVSIRFNDLLLQAPVPAGRHQFGIGISEEGTIGYFPAEHSNEDIVGAGFADGDHGQSVSLTLRDRLHLRDGLRELDQTRALEIVQADDSLPADMVELRVRKHGREQAANSVDPPKEAYLAVLKVVVEDFRERYGDASIGLPSLPPGIGASDTNLAELGVQFVEDVCSSDFFVYFVGWRQLVDGTYWLTLFADRTTAGMVAKQGYDVRCANGECTVVRPWIGGVFDAHGPTCSRTP
jgi:hypothetical protein